MRQIHPKFETFSHEAKQAITEHAKFLIKSDSLFKSIKRLEGKEQALIAAIGTATNMHIKCELHKQFGDRQIN